MSVCLAAVIGAVFGAAQLYLLILGVKSIGESKIKIWPLLVQFFCPILGLLLCAWLARDHLLLCACVIVGILLIGAVAEFLFSRKKETRDAEKRGK